MRSLSQVDPWNGCDVCRELFGRGIVPEHNWTHEVRMWWNGKVRARTRGAEPSEPFAIGTLGTAIGLTWAALSLLANKVWKEEADDAK